ncbi:error-prone DNA polymerase [Sphingomonas lenta]|uniref:error-prone DNA polymerase n=1 Tax=Sphingomonas lenta TaxID=1141887 RepID=UPI001FE87130|nr:error-prone DNA polymerase [Sphingomonas lenta]
MSYVELQVTTHFSFLRGASSPGELFKAASAMGYKKLGVTDRNSVAGVVRALVAAEEWGVGLVVGCRLDLVTGASLLVWPEDRAAWSRLTALLTRGKKRADAQRGEKGTCFLHWEDVADAAPGLVASLVPGRDGAHSKQLRWMADLFGRDRGHVCLTFYRRPGDIRRLLHDAEAARRFGLRPLATGDVLYHEPARRPLQDVMSAIRERCTVDQLGFRRERHADRHLQSSKDMERRFRRHPEAIGATAAIAERCTFSLRDLSYQYPDEIVMSGRTPQDALVMLTRNELATKLARGELAAGSLDPPPEAYSRQLDHELALVERKRYAPYFLTVNSIMSYARAQSIMCQGRGSAANSVICFVLGITSIDPIKHKLLFERFISEERNEPPDIDIDFEHERREDVIQWIYKIYGHEHAALTAVVSRFRARGAVREVGKALGLSEDMTGTLARQVWGWSKDGVGEHHAEALNLDTGDARLALALELARELIGTPRHLSQHPGGFVLTRDRLGGLVPVEPATMPKRWVIEWEKADVEELGFMKVDILGLGMLGCLRRAFDLLDRHKHRKLDLASLELQDDDPATFQMIQKADTLGVFQIESRAQMSMLPRMRPEDFYDLAIQIAIVRPGPIQGNMVHPYLKRREQRRLNPDIKFPYPTPELEPVLDKTFGVPLFQEQAMQVAIVGAGFTPGEADSLRRAMATFKLTGGVSKFNERLISGMLARGIGREFAERLVKQIEGFGSYGFPESHAASFAKIAYASSWMKCHHPDVFCAALLNAQPMGFYAPAQIVRDAKDHNVEVRPVCVLDSEWDTRMVGRLAADETGLLPLRLGMRVVAGLAEVDADKILKARARAPFTSPEDLWRRSGAKLAALEALARADAFHGFGLNRREALWRLRGLGETALPLVDASDIAEEPAVLKPLSAGREVVEDYRSTQLSLRAHPLKFLRGELDRRGMTRCGDLARIKDGAFVEVAGVILVRQRPGSARGVLFITLEDETGIANIILWPDRFEKFRTTVMSAAMLAVRGQVQKQGIVIHIVADLVRDETLLLRSIGDIDMPRLTAPSDGMRGGSPDRGDPGWKPKVKTDYHFRDKERDIPIKSRDFH